MRYSTTRHDADAAPRTRRRCRGTPGGSSRSDAPHSHARPINVSRCLWCRLIGLPVCTILKVSTLMEVPSCEVANQPTNWISCRRELNDLIVTVVTVLTRLACRSASDLHADLQLTVPHSSSRLDTSTGNEVTPFFQVAFNFPGKIDRWSGLCNRTLLQEGLPDIR